MGKMSEVKPGRRVIYEKILEVARGGGGIESAELCTEVNRKIK